MYEGCLKVYVLIWWYCLRVEYFVNGCKGCLISVQLLKNDMHFVPCAFGITVSVNKETVLGFVLFCSKQKLLSSKNNNNNSNEYHILFKCRVKSEYSILNKC